MEFVELSDVAPDGGFEALDEDMTTLPAFTYGNLPSSSLFHVLQRLGIHGSVMRFSLTPASLNSPPSPGGKRDFVDFSRNLITYAQLSAITGRRLCKSGRGFIGLMPEYAREGDEIWLTPGSKVPFVLRKLHPTGLYEFLW